MNLELIRIDALDANVHNVRRNLGDLTELADSIKAVGVLQPLTVAPRGDFFDSHRYVVIAGHRRHAAAKAAGVDTVPCVIRPDLTLEIDQIEAMLVENLQRSDLTPLEEAVAYEQLQLMGVKPGQIAKKTGRSANTVNSRLGLMRLPEKMRTDLDDGQMTLGDAEFFSKYADDEEIMAAVEKHGYRNHWAVDYILNRRKRERDEAERRAMNPQPEVDDEADDGDEEDGYSYEAEADQRRQDRERRFLIRETAKTVREAWILEQIATGSTTFWAGMARVALDEAATEWDGAAVLAALGIEPLDEDDDLDDYNLQLSRTFDKWSEIQQLHALALLVTDALQTGTEYSYRTNFVRNLRDRCGYVPADEELELLAGE